MAIEIPALRVALPLLVLVAFIWIGYPLLIWAIAQFVPRRRAVWTGTLPTVSVVLATRGSREAILERIANLQATSYPADRLEIVVALDARADEAAESVSELARGVRVVRASAPGKASALNAGVAAARGDVVVFADTAQRFEAGTIGALVDALGDESVGAVSGRLDLHKGRAARSPVEVYWALERRLRRNEARIHSAIGVTGAVYAMRRSLFEPFPASVILDDLYNPMRLVLRGYRIGYVDEAIAHETRRFAGRDEQHRKVRTLTGVLQLCQLLPAVLIPWRNPVWFQFIVHKLLRFLSPVLLAVAMAALAIGAVRALVAGDAAPWLRLSITVGAAMLLLVVLVFRAARQGVGELLRLNAAVVQAALNGMRGRWDVWR